MSDDLVSVPIANFVTLGASQARRAPGLIPLGPMGRIFCLRNVNVKSILREMRPGWQLRCLHPELY